MKTNPQIAPKQHQPSPQELSPKKVDEVPTIAEVMAKIRRESQLNPQKYLDQVHVPGGGE